MGAFRWRLEDRDMKASLCSLWHEHSRVTSGWESGLMGWQGKTSVTLRERPCDFSRPSWLSLRLIPHAYNPKTPSDMTTRQLFLNLYTWGRWFHFFLCTWFLFDKCKPLENVGHFHNQVQHENKFMFLFGHSWLMNRPFLKEMSV